MYSNFKNDIDDGVKSYFSLLKGYKSLSKEEERILLLRYRNFNDLEARNKLITSNLKYACQLASSYRGKGLSYSELISEANDALIESIDKYDLEQDVKLFCYSKWVMMQRMGNAIKKKHNKKFSSLPESEDNSKANEEIDEIVINNVEDNNNIIGEEDDFSKDYDKNYLMSDILDNLNDREIEVTNLYYGIGQKKELTLSEIGEKFGISKERARQILDKALKKIRAQAVLVEYEY